jgi:hypothetical protein
MSNVITRAVRTINRAENRIQSIAEVEPCLDIGRSKNLSNASRY